jgi:hypothetical protein
MRYITTLVPRSVWSASTLAALVSTVIFLPGAASLADEPAKDLPNIHGVWKLHARIGDDGEANELTGEEAEALIVKFISSGRWCITYADANTGSVRFHHGGTYTLKGNEYAESIKYANESTNDLVNNTFRFSVRVKGDTLTQKGIGNSFNEVWKRVKE